MTAGALDGLRVIELATVLMGPYAGQLLGDLGADVIKVEDLTGDSSRMMGAGPHPQLSGIALNLHRNKRSVALDLHSETGRAALRRLAADADVLVTNFKYSTLEKLGLSYPELAEANPRLIYCDAHGYRSDSAEADRPAFDDIIQAVTGLPALNGAIGADVNFLPILVADKVAGLFIVYGALAALHSRASTGLGQRVEVPMFDSLLGFNLVEHLSGGAVPGEKAGYSRILSSMRGPHRTSDGWIAMLPYTDRQWRNFYEAIGEAHRLEQPWHRDMRTRLLRPDEVYGELKSIVAERTTEEWLALCEQIGVPVAVVPTVDQIVNDPDLHRGALVEADHPEGFRYRQIRPPVRFSETPATDPARHAPLVGAHTREVLMEAGFTDQEVTALIADGVATDCHHD